MPSKKACMKIKDPAARQRCLNYKGEFVSKDEKVKAISKAGSKKIKSGRY